VPLSPGG
jgi:hypothetical protein